MKETPVPFKDYKVRSILDDRKNQMRQVVKIPTWVQKECVTAFGEPHWEIVKRGRNFYINEWSTDKSKLHPIKCPYGQPGDWIWVQETFAITADSRIFYRATAKESEIYEWEFLTNKILSWSRSIHMPKRAARIWLKITEVWVERLQEISEENARAEGIVDAGCVNCGKNEPCGCSDPKPDPIDSFIRQWNSINSKKPGCSWEDNPWVFVVSFKRIR